METRTGFPARPLRSPSGPPAVGWRRISYTDIARPAAPPARRDRLHDRRRTDRPCHLPVVDGQAVLRSVEWLRYRSELDLADGSREIGDTGIGSTA